MTFIDELRHVMYKNNLPFSGSINLETNKYHSFNSEGICKKKCCRYRIYENLLGAHLLCWRREINVQWFYKNNHFHKKIFPKETKETNDLAKIEWENSSDLNPDHPYIIKKRIIPYYARQYKDAVLLPIYNRFKEIISNQKIYPNGFKSFLKGCPVKEGFLVIGEIITPHILFCEGWATGCSLHEATNQIVIVCFNASNIYPVSIFFRQRFPNHSFIFCSDKDENKIGEKYAIYSAQKNGGIVLLPQGLNENETDFNDLAQNKGISILTHQLERFLL